MSTEGLFIFPQGNGCDVAVVLEPIHSFRLSLLVSDIVCVYIGPLFSLAVFAVFVCWLSVFFDSGACHTRLRVFRYRLLQCGFSFW